MGDQEEKWPELSSMLGELGAKLDRLIDAGMEKALPDYADGIVLSATAQTVQLHEGYRYNYLVVSSDAATAMGSSNTLTIDTPAIKYTQPIYEGINPLNIKGSTAKLSVSGLSGDYAAQFVETNESPLVRSAGSVKLAGTGSVQLTGSLVPLSYSETHPATNVSIAAGANYETGPIAVTGSPRNVAAYWEMSATNFTPFLFCTSSDNNVNVNQNGGTAVTNATQATQSMGLPLTQNIWIKTTNNATTSSTLTKLGLVVNG